MDQFSWSIFWVTGTPFTHVKNGVKYGDSRENNMFDVYGDSSENSFNFILSLIFFYCKSDLLRLWDRSNFYVRHDLFPSTISLDMSHYGAAALSKIE